MKLVKEHINEKFTEDSDPIKDLGIGVRYQIQKWLEKYDITKYYINDDLTIDVRGDVRFDDKLKIKKFPKYIQFNTIYNGNFQCNRVGLKTLKGCPYKIDHGLFGCDSNELTSLKYAPKEIIFGCFFCRYNNKKFTKEDVKRVCKVQDDNWIYV